MPYPGQNPLGGTPPPHIFQFHRFLAHRSQAQVILMLRDGRDVVCSLKPRTGYAAFADRLERWIYDNQAGLPWWGHPQVKVVKYEDRVAQPETTLQVISQFLGEDYNPQLPDIMHCSPVGFEKQARMAMVAKFHVMGKVISGMAAQMAGLGRVEFLLQHGQYGVAMIDLDKDELQAGLENA